MSNQDLSSKQQHVERASVQQPGAQNGFPPGSYEQPQVAFAAQRIPPNYPPAGYAASQQPYPPSQGYNAAPVDQRRRTSPWLIAMIVVIAMLLVGFGYTLVGALYGFGYWHFWSGGVRSSTSQSTSTQATNNPAARDGSSSANGTNSPAARDGTFQVGASPTLILKSDAGSVTINRASTKTIVVQASKHASNGGNPDELQVTSSQSGSTVNVAFHRPGTFNYVQGARVDFTITVPQTCDLQITTRSGNIQVNGISGKMALLSMQAASR
jgi:hypothetical protein